MIEQRRQFLSTVCASVLNDVLRVRDQLIKGIYMQYLIYLCYMGRETATYSLISALEEFRVLIGIVRFESKRK